MVDIRPLLFINALMLMLLVTAGFVQVNKPNEGPGIPEPYVVDTSINQEDSSAAEDQAPINDTDNELTADTGETKTEEQLAQAAKPESPTPSEEPSPLLSTEEVEDAIFADEAIFADNVQPPTKDTATQNAIRELNQNAKTLEPMVVSYSNTPKPAPVKKPTPITTGKIVVRSNVHDDVVLVNGKPFGPTKLELELTPGSYNVEVAKEGYNSWNAQVDVRRGMTQTLNARLEHYTTVNYQNGVWEHDIKTGEGTYIEEGTLEYNGSFVNGKFHGIGSVRYSNGMKYQGEWFEGSMKGHGTLTTPEGDTYIGELDEGKFNGEGTLTKATGDIYTGFWIDDQLNGQGTLTTQNGLLYVGGFSDNLFHGNGSLTYPDGGHYEGSFSNGMFHGKGTETYPSGKKYVGQFIDGLYHGKGELMNPNGSKITGTFKDGKPFGKATLTTAEGEIFTARSSEPGVCYRLKSYRATACPELEGW